MCHPQRKRTRSLRQPEYAYRPPGKGRDGLRKTGRRPFRLSVFLLRVSVEPRFPPIPSRAAGVSPASSQATAQLNPPCCSSTSVIIRPRLPQLRDIHWFVEHPLTTPCKGINQPVSVDPSLFRAHIRVRSHQSLETDPSHPPCPATPTLVDALLPSPPHQPGTNPPEPEHPNRTTGKTETRVIPFPSVHAPPPETSRKETYPGIAAPG